jgi:hypothetical protein
MVVKVKMAGSGIRTDPFRANLPDYVTVHAAHGDGYMIVDMPDSAHGLSPESLKHETLVDHETGPHYARLCGECVDEVHKHFDKRYAEHAGKFRLEFV